MSNLATRRNAQKRAIAKAELPPNPMMLTWELDKRPTDEWIAEHGEDFPDLPADEDMTVGVNLYAVMAFPAVGVLPANWKRGRSLLCTFQEMPYHQLEAFCREDAGLPAKPLKGAPEATDPGPCKFRLGKCIRHTDCQPPPRPPMANPQRPQRLSDMTPRGTGALPAGRKRRTTPRPPYVGSTSRPPRRRDAVRRN